MPQFKHHALTRGQFLQSPANPPAQLSPHQVPLGIRAGSAVWHLLQHIVLLAGLIGRHRRFFLAHLLFAQMIEAKIGYDAIDPGIERALKAKIGYALVRFEERFLVYILGLVLVTGELHGQPHHRLIVVPHQLLERGAVTALRFADQQRVIDTA